MILPIVPLGVGAAIYLEEYANRERWWNRAIELNIQNLAAVPSIIYGILGLAFRPRPIRPRLRSRRRIPDPGPPRPADGDPRRAGGDPGGAALDPRGLAGLGATQWQTIRRQVLPASIPGIATGVILAVSRALGEAAPLLLVGAATFVTADQPNPFEGGYSAMPVQIFNYALDPQEEFRTLAAAGVVLMLVVLLAMNSFAIWLRNRYEQQW